MNLACADPRWEKRWICHIFLDSYDEIFSYDLIDLVMTEILPYHNPLAVEYIQLTNVYKAGPALVTYLESLCILWIFTQFAAL